MRKTWTLILLLLPAFAYSQIPASMRKLPDSGQTTSFESTFGEDSDYLIHPIGYNLVSNEVLIDTVTLLMWLRADVGEMTYENALIYADTCTAAGYSDWRLPLAKEGFSILNLNLFNPSLSAPAFTASNAEYWWTSETQFNSTNKVWVTNAGGGIGNHPKNETISAGGPKRFHTRLVRDTQPVPANENNLLQISINNVSLVVDTLAKLMWPSQLPSDSLIFSEAISFCENSTLAGFDDWRLPDVKELYAAIDLHSINPCFNTSIWQLPVTKLWSSSTLANHADQSWYLDTQFGITTYALKSRRLYFIPVRTYTESSSLVTSLVPSKSQLFPNPVSGNWLQIKTELRGLVEYHIANTEGKHMVSGKMQERRIATESLAPGSYVLTLSNGSQTEQLVFIKL